MNALKPAKGMSMLLCVFLLLGAGLSITGVFQHMEIRQTLRSEILASEQIELNHIRFNLLQFATTQGYNSLTDLGRLPCPSKTKQGNPQVECLDENIGYLPRTSHTAINYLNQTVAHQRSRNIEASTWMYAVSQQVLQPNSLGWSQKVDWTKQPLEVRIGQRVITGVVALVAHDIALQGQYLEVNGPYTVITQNQIQKHLQVHMLQQVNATLRQLPAYSSGVQAQPFIDSSGPAPGATPATCQCRCTKTRCTCSCTDPALWQSEAACLVATPNCKTVTEWKAKAPSFVSHLQSIDGNLSICRSLPSEPCKFKGPAKMLNEWGISFFRPVAALSRSCRPTQYATCPTSLSPSPCECTFGWPQTTQKYLSNIKLTFNDGRWRATW